MHPIVKVTEHF